MNPDLGELAVTDPRGWTEEAWLDVFEYLLGLLSDSTHAKIEVGAYWLDGGSKVASAALGARIRADGPLLWTDSDCWEAAFCITGGSEGSYADVMAFPFLGGSVITRNGRLDDLRGDHEVEEFWLHYADHEWEDHGWRYPDGPGEWDHVRQRGDAFFRGISCASAKNTFFASEPLMISLERRYGQEPSLGAHATLTIHRLFRNGQEIVATPAAVSLARPGDSHRLPFGTTKLPASFRLDSVPIPGGWVPGKYQIEIRLNYARGSTHCGSDISDIGEFEVVAS